MGRFNKFYITCFLIDLGGSFEIIVWYSSLTIYVNGSTSVVTHKLIELNKTCIDAILKALSTLMNENEIKCVP